MVDEPLDALADGRFRVRNMYLSVDPAMRGWVSAVANYSKPVGIGEVMRSFAVGEVGRKAGHPDFAVGDPLVRGMSAGRHSLADWTAATSSAACASTTCRCPPSSAYSA